MIRRPSAALFLCVLLSGCGGGGGGSALPQSKSNAPTAAAKQNVKVSIKIPSAKTLAAAAKRNPKYISVNTQSAVITVNTQAPVIANLSSTSPSCAGSAADGSRTCTVLVSAPVGIDTFSEELFASTDGSGTPLSQNNTTQTIVAGTNNTVTMTLAGLVVSISLTLQNPTPPIGTALSDLLTVNFMDASGAEIIGDYPFADQITLTNSDTTGATSIVNTTTGAAVSVLNSPTDAANLAVSYNGAAIGPVTFSASAVYAPSTNITPAILTPGGVTPTPAPAAFVDWPTYGYDAQRSGFNPSSTAFTPAQIPNLHLAWHVETNGSQTQPIVATGIPGHSALLILGNYTALEAHDGLTGATVWSTQLPKQDVQACGSSGVAGTAVYDKALGAVFAVAGDGAGAPNHIILYELNVASGAIMNKVSITPTLLPGEANDSHAGVALVNGVVYVGTGSDCEGSSGIAYPSWRGRVVSVNPNTMTVINTFFTTWQVGTAPGNYGGGGVWAWGGVSADPAGNIYVAAGNAETPQATGSESAQPPFVTTTDEQAGYAEHLIKLTPNLTTVEGSNYPGFNFAVGFTDLDYTGSPVIFSSPACGTLSATQGKGGTLVINNTADMSVVGTPFQFSVPSPKAYYMGNPAYSPTTGYVYAAISTMGAGGALQPPGLAAINDCGTNLLWHTSFGPDSSAYAGDNPRSAPTVTAGGVVFIGTPCTASGGTCVAPAGAASGAVWALDASAGTLLGGGKPVLLTGDNIRVPPTVDGLWMYVYDTSGNLYGMTVDPTVKAIPASTGHRVAPKFIYRGD